MLLLDIKQMVIQVIPDNATANIWIYGNNPRHLVETN